MILCVLCGNNKVTSSDLLLIRKVILGIKEDFEDNWAVYDLKNKIESLGETLSLFFNYVEIKRSMNYKFPEE